MKSFEQWWITYYKYCVIAGVLFLIVQVINGGIAGFDVKGAIIFFAVITSPIGAFIGQVLVWIAKLFRLFIEIFVDYLKLSKAKKQ